jgi:hypothetical protein
MLVGFSHIPLHHGPITTVIPTVLVRLRVFLQAVINQLNLICDWIYLLWKLLLDFRGVGSDSNPFLVDGGKVSVIIANSHIHLSTSILIVRDRRTIKEKIPSLVHNFIQVAIGLQYAFVIIIHMFLRCGHRRIGFMRLDRFSSWIEAHHRSDCWQGAHMILYWLIQPKFLFDR